MIPLHCSGQWAIIIDSEAWPAPEDGATDVRTVRT